MTSATTGTGALTLGSAVTGCLTFADAGVINNEVVSYGISDGAHSEVGVGVYATAGPTLSRVTVHASTNSGNLIECTGSQHVFITTLATDTQQLNGWREVKDAWTYASANTITVPAGADNIYEVGNRIKLTNSTTKYFVVVAVASTLLTVTGGTDYALANAAISGIYVSDSTPPDFPSYFNWSGASGLNVKGFSAITAQNMLFNIIGRQLEGRIGIAGTSNNAAFTGTLPVSAVSADKMYSIVQVEEGSTKFAGLAVIENATLTIYKSWAEAGFATSGAKAGRGTISYLI